MHDSEKSDSAIVAVKPPNKAGLPAAEAVEPRAGAKGNADQQSTHRTQSRKRVTQALSRVRQARRQTPKVGAGCSNWARPDLRGGCAVMCIPTAILRTSPFRGEGRKVSNRRILVIAGCSREGPFTQSTADAQ